MLNYNKNLILKSSSIFFIGLFIGFFILNFFTSSVDNYYTEKQHTQISKEKYGVYTINIPEKLSFANESLSLDVIDVRERLDRELLTNVFWHSNTFLLIKRANRCFPVIEKILKENGIPDDFKYLAMIESSLINNATSGAGAKGYWQFLEETGRIYGLEINDNVDERLNLEKSTLAACKYFQKAYSIFGDWTLVAASYNRGYAGLKKAVDSQKTADYYNLFLNVETARYVFRIVAMKDICENPKNYGFYYRTEDLYPAMEFDEIRVNTSISDLVQFANDNNVSYRQLRIQNPWLLDDNLKNNSSKEYTIKIPKKSSLFFKVNN